jgi:phage-related protein
VISLGTFDGGSVQLAVSGNSPDPATVTVASGLVTYELVDYDYFVDGQRWDRQSYAKGLEARNVQSRVHGVVLFQLIEDRVLKVETFPGKTATEVSGFTDAALLYER